ARFDDGNGVPVVRRGDAHGVEVLAGDKLAEIIVNRAAFVAGRVLLLVEVLHGLLAVLAARGVHFANRHNLHFRVVKEAAQQSAALGADADEAHHDPVIGSGVGGPNVGGQQKGRGSAGQRGGSQETSTS